MTPPSDTELGASERLDFDSLLSPISIEDPSGEWLRYENTYDQIEELRRQDDPSLPQGVWKHDLKKADWAKVQQLCVDALETRSKDLRLAAWLFEAQIHQRGFAALADGFQLLRGLCESFWEDLHPQIDDGDAEMRFAPLRWVDDKLTPVVKALPITQPETQDAMAYTWADWERALYLSNLVRADPSVAKQGDFKDEITQDKIEVSITLTPIHHFQRLAGYLAAAEEARADLARALDELAGGDAPSLHDLRELLASLSNFVSKLLRQKDEMDGGDGAVGEAESEITTGAAEELTGLSSSGRIRSRAEAYRQLSIAAEYLLRTEPHSPAPYLVKRAVSWGNLTLIELYRELLAEGANLRTIYSLLGIKEDE